MVVASDNNHSYKTSDTSLAAYLVTEGFVVEDIDFADNRASFIFEPESTERIKELVRLWESGKAQTNATILIINYKKLARRAREATQ